jgi:hypothetical protein
MKPLLKYMLQDLKHFQKLLVPRLKGLKSRAHENQIGLMKLEGGEQHEKVEPSLKKVNVKKVSKITKSMRHLKRKEHRLELNSSRKTITIVRPIVRRFSLYLVVPRE